MHVKSIKKCINILVKILKVLSSKKEINSFLLYMTLYCNLSLVKIIFFLDENVSSLLYMYSEGCQVDNYTAVCQLDVRKCIGEAVTIQQNVFFHVL